jgi:hypothetical protein
VGFRVLRTSPTSSTATQKLSVAQETPVSATTESKAILTRRHAFLPPVGLVEVTAYPPASTAMQNRTDGQLTDTSRSGDTRVVVQLPAADGVFEATTDPS